MLIIIDSLFVDDIAESLDKERNPDLIVYNDRAETIIEGKMLYKDTEMRTRTPPAINYFLIIPFLFSHSPASYEIYFSIFNILSSLLLFLTLKTWNEKKGFYISLLFIINPFTLFTSTVAYQDEAIVNFLFLLSLSLLVLRREYLSSVSIAIGIWTKMFSILLFPLLLIKSKTLYKRLVGIVIFITIIITLPFIILAFDDFTWFLKFYFLGGKAVSDGGSFWYFLGLTGINIPSFAFLVLLGIALGIAYYNAYSSKLDVWNNAVIIAILFFIFYPKIHASYYLLPVTLLLPFALEARRVHLEIYLIFATVMVSQLFFLSLVSTEGLSILIPLGSSLATLMLLLDILRKVWKKGTLIAIEDC